MVNIRDSVNDGSCMCCPSYVNVKVIMLGNFQARMCENCLFDLFEQAHLTKRAGGRLKLVRVYEESEVEEVSVGEYRLKNRRR